MLQWILSSIICYEYQHNFKDKGDYKHAMKSEFALCLDYKKEDGYRNVELWLYAESSYVGVYSRENWTVKPVNGDKYDEGVSEWKHWSLHDSCWRSDGVDGFIHAYKDQLNTLRGFGGWYESVEVSGELLKEFREATKRQTYR